MLVVQWGAIYHPRRHTCPFVTIPNSPSSSSSSISIQHFNKSQKSINDDTEGQRAGHIHDNCIQQYFRLEIFVKERIWPWIFLDQVILAASNIWPREHLHGMPQCLDLGTMGEFWVNVVTARKAGVAIVHVHTKLCNCVQFTIMHNCELQESVRAGLELCTHTMQLHHPAPSHVSLLFLIYQLFHMFYSTRFLHGLRDWFQKNVEKPGYTYIYNIWERGPGVQVGDGSCSLDNDHTNAHTVQILLCSRTLR